MMRPISARSQRANEPNKIPSQNLPEIQENSGNSGTNGPFRFFLAPKAESFAAPGHPRLRSKEDRVFLSPAKPSTSLRFVTKTPQKVQRKNVTIFT
jgi:hypothetical protein